MKKNGKVLCFPGVNMDPSAQPKKAKRIKPPYIWTGIAAFWGLMVLLAALDAGSVWRFIGDIIGNGIFIFGPFAIIAWFSWHKTEFVTASTTAEVQSIRHSGDSGWVIGLCLPEFGNKLITTTMPNQAKFSLGDRIDVVVSALRRKHFPEYVHSVRLETLATSNTERIKGLRIIEDKAFSKR
ncbi:MAG: hypothetical protein JL50_08660 [Peptococcaceae bacterium BICA1-7]|nr:MAG: hypothetical protein JL50_08660 [Peptococcaceae bacterium BICA1-7]HBV97365.1 hypothetical protein [Desulfotomaculum sp.]